MKWVALDDLAYARLSAWRRNSNESFSSVVKRILPERGSLSAFLGFIHQTSSSDLADAELIEFSCDERQSIKEDHWG
jgi:predicted CopG family antitoxin